MVIPVWDQQLSTLTWCIDQALRAVGGAPTYLLTDNARTVTMDHVAGIPVRHPRWWHWVGTTTQLGAHLRPGAATSWQNLDLNFTGVAFDGGDFSNAVFSGGKVSFRDTVFSGGEVSFRDTVFSGGEVSFVGAEFAGDMPSVKHNVFDFSGAKFVGGRVDFREATFSGGTVFFCKIDHSTVFSSGEVSFQDAKFTGGEVVFHDAEFSGSDISFKWAVFYAGRIMFRRKKYYRYSVLGR